jgi:cytidylate kinase
MPIITISRMFGSGGSDVAALVARELGWALLDNAVIDAVAARTGLSPSEVAAREERMPSLVQRLAAAMTMSTQEMLAPLADAKLPLSEDRLLEVTRRVIEEAAARGPVVIVGRGAQEMLGSRDDLVGVFCYAPREALIARCMERDSLDASAAAKRVDEVNKQRREWVYAHWQRTWVDPESYHLCVNTHLLGVDVAAAVVVDVARKVFYRR